MLVSHLVTSIKGSPPLSKTMEFEIEELKRWGEERCKSASGKFIPAKKEAKEG